MSGGGTIYIIIGFIPILLTEEKTKMANNEKPNKNAGLIFCPYCNHTIHKYNINVTGVELNNGERIRVVQIGCTYCSKLLAINTAPDKSPIIKV